MLESLKIHIVVDQTETLEPQAYCFLTNIERGINHRTNLEQISRLITLQDLVRDKVNQNQKLISQITRKLGIQNQASIQKLQNSPLEVFYYLNADGGNQQLSDAFESINKRVSLNGGNILSFTGPNVCGSTGFAFFTGEPHTRYHMYQTVAGISLNLLESYFLAQEATLESDFELFYQMQDIVNKKRQKIRDIILDSSEKKHNEDLRIEIQSQMEDESNTNQKVILNSTQLKEFSISYLKPNHYDNLSQHLTLKELELTLCIQKVYDFLNEQSITYH